MWHTSTLIKQHRESVIFIAQEVIESGPRQRLMRRLLAAPSVGVEVPVYVAISPDQAGALADTLRSAVAAGSVAQLLTQQGEILT